jgi:N-acetylglucosamine kinase-like BadF-type ATPase
MEKWENGKIMTTLIVDSGSTKTDWVLIAGNGSVTIYKTEGINPVVGDSKVIANTIKQSFAPQISGVLIDKIHFYGAGCTSEHKGIVEDCLKAEFPQAEIEVASDVLAAARALCGHKEGIACILGTGSNSCLFNGRDIISNVSPLGYILGDEGSGAVLGRELLGNILKRQMSDYIINSFFKETKLTEAEIINRVYCKRMPNRFLASFVPFIHRHHHESQIAEFLVANFRKFLKRNVLHYNRPDLPVNFVGGVACNFGSEISVAVQLEHLTLGRIEQAPAQGLIAYHTTSASEEIV